MGHKPFFITGANAKIKINGVTIAFCTNLSYSIQVNHQATKVLGMYEGTSIEPLSYMVTGSFTVIRYVKNTQYFTKSTVDGVSDRDIGNGIGSLRKSMDTPSGVTDWFLNNGRAYESFVPGALQNGTYFDIEVYQKIKQDSNYNATNALEFASKLIGLESIAESLGLRFQDNYLGVSKIRDCRIIKSDFSLSKKSVGTQTFSFMALYADEDNFRADMSGVGQQFD